MSRLRRRRGLLLLTLGLVLLAAVLPAPSAHVEPAVLAALWCFVAVTPVSIRRILALVDAEQIDSLLARFSPRGPPPAVLVR